MKRRDHKSPSDRKKHRLARRISDVNNRKIGILINGRNNAELLARETARFYQERHRCTVVSCIEKQQATSPCPDEHLKALSSDCEFLITSVGDSETSAACIIRDSIRFEQYGRPAIVVCTKLFETSAKKTAVEMGLPDYPFVSVHHPVANSTPAEITERALHAYRQGMVSLTGMYLLIG